MKIAQGTKNLEGKTVLTKDPGVAYDMTYATKAVTELKAEGVEITGSGFKPADHHAEGGRRRQNPLFVQKPAYTAGFCTITQY